jgi:hypothetical protein
VAQEARKVQVALQAVRKVHRDRKVLLGLKVHKANLGHQAQEALKVVQAFQVHLAPAEFRGLKVHQAQEALKVVQAFQVHLASRVRKVRKVRRAHKAILARKDLKEQLAPEALKV